MGVFNKTTNDVLIVNTFKNVFQVWHLYALLLLDDVMQLQGQPRPIVNLWYLLSYLCCLDGKVHYNSIYCVPKQCTWFKYL